MITIRPAHDRGQTQMAWLDSRHTFSFGEYYDAAHMGFRKLRVINDDRVAPGGGFATHGHRDMEIITYVLDGALEHKDSLGNGSIIRPGEVQRMSAGTGITHSEFNHSKTEPVHFLQIWILPEATGLGPGYEQRAIPPQDLRGQLRLIGTRDGRGGAVTVHQDVEIWAAILAPGHQVSHRVRARRHVWVQVARGAFDVSHQHLGEGDGAAISDEPMLEIRALEAGEVLLFDLG